MTPFEYVIVLISIILGMGITQLVTGIADMVHQWHKVKIYWPHLLWITVVFTLHIQDWWSTYEYRSFDAFRLPTFLFILLYPINLFVLARILFPLVSPGEEVDLKKFYDISHRKFFAWAAGLPAISLLTNIFVTGRPLTSQLGHMVLLLTFIVLLSVKHIPQAVHKLLAAFLLASTLVTLGWMWNDLLH